MTSNTSTQAPFVPGRLISHFQGREREAQGNAWAALWDTDQSDLWDRGKPSPALIDLIESPATQPPILPRPDDASTGRRRPRALVPGCGKGYDVVMLALHGYDAYGLEVSTKAVATAQAYAASQLAAPSEYNFGDAQNQTKYAAGTPGLVKFVVGDFFGMGWEVDCRPDDDGDGGSGFDLIYDYTFLCALLPQMRRDWARRMGELLAPSGVLVCLEFPLYKDLKLPGPPWGLREGVYWDLLAGGGNGMIEDEEVAKAATQGPAGGVFERVQYVKPPRSYEVAKGTDMLSVWTLKDRRSRP